LGLLAFVLGISLVLEGALYFGTALTSSNSRSWMVDSFKSDWRQTREFRNFVCDRLKGLITMGAGGWPYQGYYWDDWGRPVPKTEAERWAQSVHEKWKGDKNVLYSVEKDGEALYINSGTLTPSTQPSGLPEGYGFLLQFDGEKVRIWMDGEEQHVYNGDYYHFDQQEDFYQWYVPGYKNFTVDEAGSKVKVAMAVINSPQIFIKGSYGNSGSDQYSGLYYVKQDLESYREEVTGHAVRLGVGLALVVVYVLLRRDKKRADQALARWTGKVWFEVKIILLLLLVYFNFPRMTIMYDVWDELTYSYAPTAGYAPASSTASETINGDIAAEVEQRAEELAQQGVPDAEIDKEIDSILAEYGYEYPGEQATRFGTAVTILSENADWLLKETLLELSNHTGHLLVLFWSLYLLLFNDWRYNKHPWRHGVFVLLYAGELKYPLQKRLSRVCGLTALAVLLLGTANLSLLVYETSYSGSIPLEAVWCIALPAALVLLVAVAFIWRQRRLWTDFGAVADYAADLRAGTLEGKLSLPQGSDLGTLADDLDHIQQGLHQAVEERTRSERMKVELVTNVSHDLKTPLTSIISYTELLAQEPLEPPASEYVQILGEKAQRLRAMVQDVFEVSKAASGQLPVKLERLDYARLLRQTLADMDGAIRDSGLVLRASVPEEVVPITADSDRLYRVFQNLIGNALKYSLPGSRVYLSLAVEEGRAAARIQNTSATELKPGADYTARFVRGDESRSDGGSGLGLSIAESFTRACGGQLSVTTEADLFSVCVAFPLLEEA